MKVSKFLVALSVCAATTFFLNSCKKENTTDNPIKIENQDYSRNSGVVEDDPAMVAKVPMIVSADFLKRSKDIPSRFFASRTNPHGGSDITPPTVSISSPSNSSTVSGSVNVQATASDNVGVMQVSFSVDGVASGSSSAAPYTFPWNSATLANGTHTLMVTAKDAAGNTKSSSIQVTGNNVSAGDITSPTVSITSPANGASVSGTVNIAANAADNVGVSSVKFSVDGTILGSDNTSPYSFSWNSATVANGIHTLNATATDAAGNIGSYSLQVTVNTVVINPPPLPASYQIIMPPVGNQGSEGACTAFAVGYYTRSAEQYYRTGANSYSNAANIFSPEFLFDQTELGSNCTGSAIIISLNFLVSTGICTWQSSPYSDYGCTNPPTAQQTSEAGSYKIASYSKIYKTDIATIKTMLSSNHPLIGQFSIDDAFRNAGPGFIWRSLTTNIGLHSMAVVGYDDSKNAFRLINQWGTSWGDAGYIWVDYSFFQTVSSDLFKMN